ncbi:MAG: hypothetical protein OQK25_03375 [Gammaproteobacteria bacterium]|nr:hypothetical protein [Gammaproteobacteria bacterium]MCW8983569.1 hypothetical protein [Gammaproteobacteria bacterium]
MNTKILSIIAITLWLVTVLVAGTMFIKGTTGEASDGRTAIYVNQTERDMILAEMRGFLNSFQMVLEGIQTDNLPWVKEVAQISGSAEIEGVSPTLMGKLPIQFKQWGRAVHKDFDDIAFAVDQGENREQLLKRVSLQLKSCIECHKSYRLDLEPTK